MGCWNGTCQLSNLPITEDTPVYLIFTVPNPHLRDTGVRSSITCYANSMFEPVFLPIKGTYNDYGSINVEDNSLNEEIFKFFNELISRNKVQVKKSSGYKPNNLEGFIRCVERGLVSIQNNLMTAIAGQSNLGFVMVREDVLKNTLNTLPKETKYSFYISYDEELEKENYMTFFESYDDTVHRLNGFGCASLISETSHLSNTLREFYLYYLLGEEDVKLNVVEQAFDNFVSLYGTIILMGEFRKSFAPLSGGGSQSYSEHYEKFFKVCLDVIEQDEKDE